MKFVLKPKPGAKFRALTSSEIKDHSAELSSAITNFALGEVKRRFGGGKPPVGAADAMQVAMTAMAIAEGLLTIEALKTGLPVQKLREIHDKLVMEIMQRHRP